MITYDYDYGHGYCYDYDNACDYAYEYDNACDYAYEYDHYHHFYIQAQLVGGFTLSDLLDKPWSQVSSLPPGTFLHFFIGHRVQHSHCSSIFIEYC